MSDNRHGHSQYADSAPYPKIKVLAPNPCYASLLMDDYAGVVSEFTAISQYLYHYFYFKRINQDLGDLLESISIIEMHHMEILAELIILLGGNPMIRGSQSTNDNFWNGSFIYYGSQVADQLKADIDAEYKAIHDYQHHIRLINDPYIQAILHRVILDEKVHIRLFKEALRKYCGQTYP